MAKHRKKECGKSNINFIIPKANLKKNNTLCIFERNTNIASACVLRSKNSVMVKNIQRNRRKYQDIHTMLLFSDLT